ncbi:transcription factor ILR3-like [Iris pallida]|uniref:Transcription factor ILR3-like n=1 Tax=Iris pallida TaxID=29817 RepID=A0AAX6GUL7_IRIPA|nr:transcription factor ILR3-like [Iris pallida]
MDPNPISDFWIDDDVVGDGELRCALESFCDLPPDDGVGFQDGFRDDGCCLDQSNIRKRARDESCTGPKSKSCREKLRRDKLNDRFSELSSVLDPGRPPRSDKSSILCDAARLLVQLKAEAEQLKESNEKLQETIKELKLEKNELRDEKVKLKTDKERLEQQVKAMSVPQPAFVPHPMAFHPAVAPTAAFSAHAQVTSKKGTPAFPAYPGMAMWQWLSPAVLDTSQDAKLWSPNA